MNDKNTEIKPHESHEIEVLTFTCPRCGSHLIEEIVMMERIIEWMVVPGDPDYDWNEDYAWNVPIPPHRTKISSKTDRNHYRCQNCGAPLLDKDGNNFWGVPLLLEWLRQKRDEEAMEQPRSKMFLFTCPGCGGHDLQEIHTNAVTSYDVKGVFNEGKIAWGRYHDIGKDEDVHLECWDCDYEFDDDYEELVERVLGQCPDHADESRQG